MDWCEPRSFREWLPRAFGLRPFLTLLVVLGFFITEFRFDWVERVLGVYLTQTNAARPESGTIWDEGHRSVSARNTLDKIVADRLTTRREVQNTDSLMELFDSMPKGGGGIMLIPDHFRSLYLDLPPSVAYDILSPYELIEITSSGTWVRTYVEKGGTDLTFFLLDTNNRVLRQLQVSAGLLHQIQQHEAARSATLDSLSEYRNRVYPASRFFSALASLPDDVRSGVIPQPEKLLMTSGRIHRVGIADEVVAGFIGLAFEVTSDARHQVIFMQGQEWAVWQLRTKLEETETLKKSSPILKPTE